MKSSEEAGGAFGKLLASLEGGNRRLSERTEAWTKMLSSLGYAFAIREEGGDPDRVRLNTIAREDLLCEETTCSVRALEAQGLEFLAVSDGTYVWTPRQPADNGTKRAALSVREREVLNWAKDGKTVEETAVILGISPRTVEKHRENIYRKTGTANLFHIT